MYELIFAVPVEKDFNRIDRQHHARILKKIEKLRNDPRPHGSRRLVDAVSSYRIRVGDFRVIYQIDERAGVVTIMHVRHRKDAYA